MKKKAKKKSAFRKRRNIRRARVELDVNVNDLEFFRFIAKASREGRL